MIRRKKPEVVFLGAEAAAPDAMEEGWQDEFIEAVGGRERDYRWIADACFLLLAFSLLATVAVYYREIHEMVEALPAMTIPWWR